MKTTYRVEFYMDNTYKVNHCDGNKNEKELLEFIDELEQLTIPNTLPTGANLMPKV